MLGSPASRLLVSTSLRFCFSPPRVAHFFLALLPLPPPRLLLPLRHLHFLPSPSTPPALPLLLPPPAPHVIASPPTHTTAYALSISHHPRTTTTTTRVAASRDWRRRRPAARPTPVAAFYSASNGDPHSQRRGRALPALRVTCTTEPVERGSLRLERDDRENASAMGKSDG